MHARALARDPGYLLSGLDRPSSGEIWLTGRRLDQLSERALAKLRRTTVGFVFQAFHLIDELTALENVELPMLLAGRPSVGARRRAIELLGSVGLAHRTEHLPAALSGGEQQRVAIARAVSNEPTVIFADEPTGNLDSHATADVLELLQALHGSGRTLILATHDPAVAATAGRVLAMRDGSLLAESTPHGT